MEVINPLEEIAGSIFSQSWWLDAVAPDAWGEVRVEKGGTLYARMPYVRKQKLGLKVIDMPLLTQSLGPWLRPYQGKYTNQLAEEKELMTTLIDQLPAFDIFKQNFHHSITNWLPFYWKGFSETTRYTYVIEDLSDKNVIWNGLRENIRTDIRKAQKIVTVRDDLTLDDFLNLNRRVFSRQGKVMPYSTEFVTNLDTVCLAKGQRKIFIAEDGKGQLHAAVYIVWDEESAYYLMGGSDPDLRNSGATSLCMWEAIKFASSVTHKFDFEGSMIEPVERFFRAFGARQRPYFQISKINSHPLKIIKDIRSWV